MTTPAFDALFSPRSIAVIGASEGTSATGAPKMGAAAMRYLIEHGFKGDIYPVNPRAGEIMGRKAYPSLAAIPGTVDTAFLLVPANACAAAMEECAAKGVRGVVVFTSGFAEAGEQALQDALKAKASAANIRFVGPNTAGFVNVAGDMVASISMVCEINPFSKGPIAFVTQSGALGGSMLGRGMEQGIGFSHWISTGNEADIDAAEYVDYLLDQPEVKVVALFLEGVRDGPRFLAAAEKAARLKKPIVVYKTGLSKVAAAVAASHTGALAGSDRIFDGVCRQFGLIRVDDVADLFPIALTFAWINDKLPRGKRVGIVSASGGICGVAADECFRFGLEIPELSEAAKQEMRGYTPAFASLRNPVDVTGQIRSFPTGYQDVVRRVLAEPTIDGVILLVTMAAEPRASFYGREIPALAKETDKPIVVSWSGAISVAQQGYPMLSANSTPNFLTVRQAVRAMRMLADHRAFLDRFAGRRGKT